MPDHLGETGWKAKLAKPKNAPLRAMKTGVSEQLRAYKTTNDAFTKRMTDDTIDKLVDALVALKRTLAAQIKQHKNFTDATTYMREIGKAADKRMAELDKNKNFLADAKRYNDAMKAIGSL